LTFDNATLAVCRAKKGMPSTPIRGDELRALRRLAREQDPKSPFVFTSERGAPFTTAGFARMVERAGGVAGFEFKAHPHMLRHACGFALANKGHDTRSLPDQPRRLTMSVDRGQPEPAFRGRQARRRARFPIRATHPRFLLLRPTARPAASSSGTWGAPLGSSEFVSILAPRISRASSICFAGNPAI
jgi:Phage integrase family